MILSEFLILIISLSLVIVVTGEIAEHRYEADFDSQYYNSDGDHIYYERSLIEKKEYMRRFPNIHNLRSFSRLFRHRN